VVSQLTMRRTYQAKAYSYKRDVSRRAVSPGLRSSASGTPSLDTAPKLLTTGLLLASDTR